MYTGLGDRVDNLNEELLRTKELMGLLIEKTSSTGVYHEWKECGNSTGPSVKELMVVVEKEVVRNVWVVKNNMLVLEVIV